MHFLAIFISILYFVINVNTIVLVPCEGNIPPPLSTWGNACQEEPCVIERGQILEFYISFNNTYEIKAGTVELKVALLGVVLDIPMPDKDLCHGMLVGKCPLQAGHVFTYESKFEILKQFPKVKFVGQMIFKDENKKPFVCFTFPAEFI